MKKILFYSLYSILLALYCVDVMAYEHQQQNININFNGFCRANLTYHYNTILERNSYFENTVVVDEIKGQNNYKNTISDYCRYSYKPSKIVTSLYSTSNNKAYIEMFAFSSLSMNSNSVKSIGTSKEYSSNPLSLDFDIYKLPNFVEGLQYHGHQIKTVMIDYSRNIDLVDSFWLKIKSEKLDIGSSQKIASGAMIEVCAIDVAQQGPDYEYCKEVKLANIEVK